MQRILLGILFLCSVFAQAQSIEIKGKIIEETSKKPLESVTVYLNRVKDSTLINYAITDRSGQFSFRVDKQSQASELKASFVSFEAYTKQFPTIEAAIDLGTIQLKEDNMLDEVIVKSEAPPIRIKNDTLEFNAASFRVRPDANVETLIKQLPGVEIDADGKITVNGKEVNQILVNGKPFFDKDGKVALQSLPSEIINKVQVTDTKTKREEQTGQRASGNNASINLTIDEDKNKGFFGRIMGGYGTDDRYESSLMLNYFKGDRKLSVLASANNINSTGFSMDEIFDNMGGGRNMRTMWNSNGSFAVNGMNFGMGQGITTSSMAGLNYFDKLAPKHDVSANYLFQQTNRENDNRSSAVNFLPTGNFTTESTSRSVFDSQSHRVSAQLEGNFGKDQSLSYFIRPSFNTSTNSSSVNSMQGRWDENGRETLNAEGVSTSEGKSDSFELAMDATQQLGRKNNWINIGANIEVNENDLDSYTKSDNYFFFDTDNDGINDQTTTDLRNQISGNRTQSRSINLYSEYSIPITDSLRASVNMTYDFSKNQDDKATFDYDGSAGFTSLNDELTRSTSIQYHSYKPQLGMHFAKTNWSLDVQGGTSIYNYSSNGLYMGESLRLNRTYMLPSANLTYLYKIMRSKNIMASYYYNVDDLNAQQWLPIANLENPQNTVIGNADLDLTRYHTLFMSFRNFDFGSRSGYTLHFGGSYYDDKIVNYTTYDDSRRATTTYRNVDGIYNMWFGGNYTWNTKWGEAHKLRYTFGARANLGFNKGFIDGELYEANSRTFTPNVSMSYDYGEVFSIQPRYEIAFSDTQYKNFTRNSMSNQTHKLTAQTTLYWPKNVTLGNDFSYTYNSAIADGYQKDFYLWNISLGYTFFKDQLTAKVKVYDVLNQNVSATRTINENGIFDAENTVLRQYAMFSLTYKLHFFGTNPNAKSGPNRPRRVHGSF